MSSNGTTPRKPLTEGEAVGFFLAAMRPVHPECLRDFVAMAQVDGLEAEKLYEQARYGRENVPSFEELMAGPSSPM